MPQMQQVSGYIDIYRRCSKCGLQYGSRHTEVEFAQRELYDADELFAELSDKVRARLNLIKEDCRIDVLCPNCGALATEILDTYFSSGLPAGARKIAEADYKENNEKMNLIFVMYFIPFIFTALTLIASTESSLPLTAFIASNNASLFAISVSGILILILSGALAVLLRRRRFLIDHRSLACEWIANLEPDVVCEVVQKSCTELSMSTPTGESRTGYLLDLPTLQRKLLRAYAKSATAKINRFASR
jgi:uncharacterized protein (DUF983 family)